MKTSIALIGFMGTGKTAVGKVLAAKMGKEFIELDSLIEQRARKSIPEIFQQDGEIGFRELEIEAVKDVADTKNAVIACGGGMVLNKINIDRLRKECIIVYLAASPGIILKRTSEDKNERPLLAVPDRPAQIRELLRFRQPFYQRAADIKIDTSKLDIDSVAERIVEKLREDESYR
jgi:shikimate kinase